MTYSGQNSTCAVIRGRESGKGLASKRLPIFPKHATERGRNSTQGRGLVLQISNAHARTSGRKGEKPNTTASTLPVALPAFLPQTPQGHGRLSQQGRGYLEGCVGTHPGPTDQPALGKSRTQQERTSTEHYGYRVFWRRSLMPSGGHPARGDRPRTPPGRGRRWAVPEPGDKALILFWATRTGIPATAIVAATSKVVPGHCHSQRFLPESMTWDSSSRSPFSSSAGACTPAAGSG